ncbi:DUF2065 domain-containing protein [Salinisphaera aquimarina]|uniref:DUF2065 domain-containing protein n=1 Tax=Salinisphaera aquimarina TaxID=2094031 RepID=A0ABV7ETX9_9GAMM
MWPDLLRAFALVLVIEGLLPFLAPERWREMMQRASVADARSLRLFGGALIAVGVVLLQFLH